MKKITAFLILIFTTNIVQASDWTARGIYEAVKESCLLLPADKLLPPKAYDTDKRTYYLVYSGNFPGEKLRSLLYDIRKSALKEGASQRVFKASEYTTALLKSKELDQALEECYPGSAVPKNFIKKSIAGVAPAGRNTGFFAMLVFFKGVNFGLSKGILLFTTWGKATAASFTQWMQRGFNGALLTNLIPTSSEQGAQNIAEADEPAPMPQLNDQQTLEILKASLERMKAEKKHLEEELAQATDAAQKQKSSTALNELNYAMMQLQSSIEVLK